MKQFKTVLVLSFFTLLACGLTEQGKEGNEVPLSAEKEIAVAVDSLLYAMVNPEKTLLDKLTAENLTYGHSTGLIQNKTEFMDDIIDGEFKFLSINISDPRIYISGEAAVVRHKLSAEGTDEGNPVDVQIGVVLFYQKQNNQWKLLARQAYKS